MKEKRMKVIPQKVKMEFSKLSAMYGEQNIVNIGNRKGIDYFLFEIPRDPETGEYPATGFPNVIAYENGDITNITGFDALDIIESFHPED